MSQCQVDQKIRNTRAKAPRHQENSPRAQAPLPDLSGIADPFFGPVTRAPSTNTWGQTYYVDVPAHNVTFDNNSGQKVNINVFSSRAVGAALMSSKVNTYGNLGTIIKKHFQSWDPPKDVGMLDGCYTVMWTSYSGCPGGWQNCEYDIVDYPVCVGGDANATLAVDLDDN